MNDPIDRQAAIDALDEQIKFCDNALCDFNISLKDEYAVKVERASLCAYKEILEDLPSAQTELSEIKRDLSDIISREAAIHAVFESAVGRQMLTGHRDLIDILKNLPPAQPDLSGYSSRLWKAAYERGKAEAQPDIIHCGECRHFATKGNIERVEFGKCSVIKSVCLCEDYCSWAERKEGEAK